MSLIARLAALERAQRDKQGRCAVCRDYEWPLLVFEQRVGTPSTRWDFPCWACGFNPPPPLIVVGSGEVQRSDA